MRWATVRRLGVGLGVATAVHLALWPVVSALRFGVFGSERVATNRDDTASADDDHAVPLGQVTVVELARMDIDQIPQIPLAALLGPADEVGRAQTHPAPNQPVNLPGDRAAKRGGGDQAGELAFTEHVDPSHDVPIRHELWNGKRDYQAGHDRTGPTAQSKEAVRRDDKRDIADRAVAVKVATAGAEHATNGRSTTGKGDGTTVVVDKARDANAGVVTPQATDGSVRPNPTAPLADPGSTSTDTPKRADQTSDNTNATAASHDTKSGPFEVTPPGSGGPQRAGVAGKQATGQLSTSSGDGTAATTWGAPRGDRDLAITAEAQDPYFRQLFARLAKTIVFPHDLMLQLRTGRPIAELVLRADGTITRTAISVPCGTPGFDRELLRAIATLKRLPAVPVALLHGKPEIRVRVEWAFDPGILR